MYNKVRKCPKSSRFIFNHNCYRKTLSIVNIVTILNCMQYNALQQGSWLTHISTTRMWANAQRNGRPAEYRWRPLFNAAKFGWCPLRLPCSNAAKTRNPLKFAGVPQTGQPISAASAGPKFTILWGQVEEILLLNKFFSDCQYMPYLRRYSPTKLCDGAQMAIFGDFLRPVFAASRVQRISDLHSKFALGPRHV